MNDILYRLLRIARAHVPERPDILERIFPAAGPDSAQASGRRQDADFERLWEEFTATGEQQQQSRDNDKTPPQVSIDLALFDLTPPSSLEEVRQARNREIKKYHSDRFMHDPEKAETAKEVMQILNAAFTRLQRYYKGFQAK